MIFCFFFFSSRRRHTRFDCDWSSDVCSSDLAWSPKVPAAPSGTLALASVYQSWDSNRRVDQDAVRVVPMQTLRAYQDHIQTIYADLAELRLSVDVSGRHSGVKKGLFADPMLDNGLRDAGRSQSAHILGGQLQLPMNAKLHQIGTDITSPQTTPYQPVVVLDQLGRTGSMLVNPYGAFDVLPSAATLTPAVDYWTDVQTQWANPIILRLTPSQARPSDTEKLLSESTKALEKLRQIDVQFWLDFPVGETRSELIFDGRSEEHTSELQSQSNLVCRLLLEKKKYQRSE